MGDHTWHKHFQLYVTYPDSFCENSSCTLYQLADQIPRIKKLGFDAIHVLPPFESPMIDKGFDVFDYYNIRSELGGNQAFDAFLVEAQKHKVHVFIDFVLNHVSDQHEWFQKAIAGDTYYQDFFVTRKEPPLFEGVVEKGDMTFARYRINDTAKDIRVIFPDQAGTIPHWIEHNGIWYYHTFYPQQIDLNWHNPNVFDELVTVLTHWAQKGCSFRLDAVPHVGKRWEDGMQPNTDATHTIMHKLRNALERVNPDSVFLLEVSADTKTVAPHFGTKHQREADLAYVFELTEKLWIALLLGDTDPIWEILDTMHTIPDHAQWVTFLRNHDNLSFKLCDEATRTRLFDTLSSYNVLARNGAATGGRTVSLLRNDPKRTIIAHLLLASLPGNPALMYGDEIGKANDVAYMKAQTQLKLDVGVRAEDDVRDIARGQILENDLHTSDSLLIQDTLTEIFTTRAQYLDIATTYPQRVETDHNGLFAAFYELTGGELHVCINLSNTPVTVETTLTNPILTIHDVQIEQERVTLGPYSGMWATSG